MKTQSVNKEGLRHESPDDRGESVKNFSRNPCDRKIYE